MASATPPTLEYENPRERELYSNRWSVAYRALLAYYVVVVAAGVVFYYGTSMHRLRPYWAGDGTTLADRAAIELATSNWALVMLLVLGVYACSVYRRAHLYRPYHRALRVYQVLVVGILGVRVAANVYVEAGSGLTLYATAAPWKFFRIRSGSDAVGNVLVCLLLALPAFVSPFLMRRGGRRE